MVEKSSKQLIERVSSTLDRFADNAMRVEELDIRLCPLLLVGGGKNIVGLKDCPREFIGNIIFFVGNPGRS